MTSICPNCGTKMVVDVLGETQTRVLGYIVEAHPIMPGEVATQLGMTGPAVYQAVQRLRKKGLLERPPRGARNHPLRPTPDGVCEWKGLTG